MPRTTGWTISQPQSKILRWNRIFAGVSEPMGDLRQLGGGEGENKGPGVHQWRSGKDVAQAVLHESNHIVGPVLIHARKVALTFKKYSNFQKKYFSFVNYFFAMMSTVAWIKSFVGPRFTHDRKFGNIIFKIFAFSKKCINLAVITFRHEMFFFCIRIKRRLRSISKRNGGRPPPCINNIIFNDTVLMLKFLSVKVPLSLKFP